ncbi:hypothetical protein [Fusobacterium varium]|jgi:hypothetical protein|uniref:hypothetical protein n=1 Tax=Fusobacterium varium TaxID=856 RepID=UPI00242C733C|nr:hypothetical protein [Fusobacterium varium]MCF0171707.1 hypothetical protein [Fusobacterium varium]
MGNRSYKNGIFTFNQQGIYRVDITYNIFGINKYRDLNLKIVKSNGKIQYAGVTIDSLSASVLMENVGSTISLILNSNEVNNFYITAFTSASSTPQIKFKGNENLIFITKL